jgi:hypothetical protein
MERIVSFVSGWVKKMLYTFTAEMTATSLSGRDHGPTGQPLRRYVPWRLIREQHGLRVDTLEWHMDIYSAARLLGT